MAEFTRHQFPLEFADLSFLYLTINNCVAYFVSHWFQKLKYAVTFLRLRRDKWLLCISVDFCLTGAKNFGDRISIFLTFIGAIISFGFLSQPYSCDVQVGIAKPYFQAKSIIIKFALTDLQETCTLSSLLVHMCSKQNCYISELTDIV